MHVKINVGDKTQRNYGEDCFSQVRVCVLCRTETDRDFLVVTRRACSMLPSPLIRFCGIVLRSERFQFVECGCSLFGFAEHWCMVSECMLQVISRSLAGSRSRSLDEGGLGELC